MSKVSDMDFEICNAVDIYETRRRRPKKKRRKYSKGKFDLKLI
jgi:hypothetical protein